MAAIFRVFTTSAFDRSLRQLAKKNPGIPEMFEDLVTVLESDPQNTSRKHNIKKLTGVEAGDGQWRVPLRCLPIAL